jgi:hypothetical protein
MKINRGQLFYYRTYDVADEADTKMAASLLQSDKTPSWFQLRKMNRSILIEDIPVVMNLGTWEQEILGQVFKVRAEGKLWSFGAMSICFIFELPHSLTLVELNKISQEIDFNSDVQKIADDKVLSICQTIGSALKNFRIWKEYEDFLIYNVEQFDQNYTVRDISNNDELFKLIIGVKAETISDQYKEMVRKNIFSFTNNDFVVMDWNSALIYDPTDYKDISDVIEFALVQLLEMRYYDRNLDDKINSLYKSLESKSNSILTNKYGDISKEAAKTYIEISEIVEKVENSLKVIGDFYYSQIFRAASDRFRFRDWQQSVDSKLNNLAEVSKLFQGEINERRNQLMEIIIIALIAVEVVPLVGKVIAKFF